MRCICFINYSILRLYMYRKTHKSYSRAATPATARAPAATPARLPLLDPVELVVAAEEVPEPEPPLVVEGASVPAASVLEDSVLTDSTFIEVLVETGSGVVLRIVFWADLEWGVAEAEEVSGLSPPELPLVLPLPSGEILIDSLEPVWSL